MAILAASVLLGARLFAAADDTVAVWAVGEEIGAGEEVTADDLVATQVRFADPGELDRYFPADHPVPGGLRLVHGVGAGDLLPASAVTDQAETGLVQVPVAVEPEQVPSSVAPGTMVDVYLADPGQAPTAPTRAAGPVMREVRVVEAPAMADSFSTSGRRQVVLAVPEKDAERFFATVGRMQTPALTVVARG